MPRNLALKQAIVSKDLKYWEVAEKIGCKELDICKLVTGRVEPSYGLAKRIAAELEIDPRILFPEVVGSID